MARGTALSSDIQDAVTAALLAGQGISEIATEYKIGKATVSRIKASLAEQGLSPEIKEIAAPPDAFGNAVNAYLFASLAALKAQSEIAADPTYLRKYPPQQLAVLHGIMADKAARIIEACSGTSRREDTVSEGQEEGE